MVNVVDINDNSPRFEQKQYSASILENVSIGMDILEANAVDNDIGNNGRLRFTILSGDPRGDFEINEANNNFFKFMVNSQRWLKMSDVLTASFEIN